MYNLKIIRCGKRLEIYRITGYTIAERGKEEEFYKCIPPPEKLVKSKQIDFEDMDKYIKDKKKNRKDTLNKARNNIIRLIKSNDDMQTFITLTFAKELDYKESKKCLNNCFNKLRRKYKDLKYLWVLEYGDKNGRLHFHLLCNIKIKIKLCGSKKRKTEDHKELEQEFNDKYWGYGFVDIRSLSQEGNTNIALYISSYIVKSLEGKELEGYRVYGYSNKTLEKPIVEKYLDKRDIHEILKDYKDYKITFNNQYPIGYIKDGKDRTGMVTYFDMEIL